MKRYHNICCSSDIQEYRDFEIVKNGQGLYDVRKLCDGTVVDTDIESETSAMIAIDEYVSGKGKTEGTKNSSKNASNVPNYKRKDSAKPRKHLYMVTGNWSSRFEDFLHSISTETMAYDEKEAIRNVQNRYRHDYRTNMTFTSMEAKRIKQ